MPHAVGAVEVALPLVLILPALMRVLPQRSTAVAACLGGVALVGTTRPASGMSTGVAALNMTLAGLAALVVWGRLAKSPIAPFDEETSPEPDRDPSPDVAGRLSIGNVPSHP